MKDVVKLPARGEKGSEDGGRPGPEGMLGLLREQLFQAQKLASLGALASSVVHEFNNILTAIINQCEFARRLGTKAAMERALERIQTAGERASTLATRMLGQAARRDRRVEAVDLGGLMDEALALVERDLTKHGVRVNRQYGSGLTARADANQLQQVFLNLLINARQAMSEGGLLTVSMSEDARAGTVSIAIADTGSGIAPEVLERMFEPFYTTREKGTGLGLAVSREIVREHGGDILAASAAGRGAVMTVVLPSATRAEAAALGRRRQSA